MTLRQFWSVCALVALASDAAFGASGETRLQQRLAACNALASSGTYEVGDATRVFINLPRDIYPGPRLQEAPHGATFSWISEGVPVRRADAALRNKSCWSTYGEFDEVSRCITRVACHNSVEIRAKSAVPGIPDYRVTFDVIPY